MDFSTLEALKPLLISIQTLVLFILFICLVVWAYSKRRKSTFDEQANSIFSEDELVGGQSQGTDPDRAGAIKK